MNGYIKIDRKILDWEWYRNINTKIVFLHLLLKANWSDEKSEGNMIPRGSLRTSTKNISIETGLTENEVRTAVKHLKSTGEITSKGTNKFTVFTIKNYDYYQSDDEQKHKRSTNKSQTINKPLTTYKKEKEFEEEKKENNSAIFSEIVALYNDICRSYKRVIKLSEARKRAISARLRQGYTIDDFKRLFEMAEDSEFLKGGNDRNWMADFDWLIRDSNIVKTLEGKYNKDGKPKPRSAAKQGKNRFACIPSVERNRLVQRGVIDVEAESMDLSEADETDKAILKQYGLIRR